MTAHEPSSLLKFWAPRYWPTWLLYTWMRISVFLPLRLQILIGKKAGRFLSLLVPEKRRITAKNLEVCFPRFSPEKRKTLRNNHFESMGAAIPEMAMGWFGVEQVVRNAVQLEGEEYLDEALNKGKGVLLFCGHFTPLEFIYPVLRPLCPRLTGMYRPMRNKMLDELMCRGRARSFDEFFSKYSARSLVKSLAKNAVVVHLTDQCYTGKHSALVPFFGEPAMTSTATSRILKMSGATLLSLFYRRREDDAGYVAQISPPLENFPTDDPVEDTERLMKEIENYILTCPEQYAWMHKRVKGRPETYPDIYARSAPA